MTTRREVLQGAGRAVNAWEEDGAMIRMRSISGVVRFEQRHGEDIYRHITR